MTGCNHDRRNLIKGAAAAAVGGWLAGGPTRTLGSDAEERWRKIAAAYTPSDELLNLNNAAVSPQPRVVQDATVRALRHANEHPDVIMWEVLDSSRERTKEKLAQLADCDVEEIALNRNATEGLCTAIFGIQLRAGDEVLLSDWDYDSMRHAWHQRARREGVVTKWVEFDLLGSDDEIVDAYRRTITRRTKVMQLTHMLHYTGRVMPVERLCRIAKEHGIQTVVDAAQSFAHVPLSFRTFDCDYLAASLHKWLCAPFGTGLLIVRKSRIDALWPLLAPFDESPPGIGKLDGWSLGTYSSPAEHAIESAIDFHNSIGTMAIHQRLRELSRYWIDRAAALPGFEIQTPTKDPQLGAVTLFSIAGRKPEDIEQILRRDHGIRVKARRRKQFSGVRVSPHIYTLKSDLDRFVSALGALT